MVVPVDVQAEIASAFTQTDGRELRVGRPGLPGWVLAYPVARAKETSNNDVKRRIVNRG
jgi:hypothetical protein